MCGSSRQTQKSVNIGSQEAPRNSDAILVCDWPARHTLNHPQRQRAVGFSGVSQWSNYRLCTRGSLLALHALY